MYNVYIMYIWYCISYNLPNIFFSNAREILPRLASVSKKSVNFFNDSWASDPPEIQTVIYSCCEEATRCLEWIRLLMFRMFVNRYYFVWCLINIVNYNVYIKLIFK